MDDVDYANQTRVFVCPNCKKQFEDLNPDVAAALLRNHTERKKCEAS